MVLILMPGLKICPTVWYHALGRKWWRPLYLQILASSGRSPETVKLLLEKGVDVNYANEDGNSISTMDDDATIAGVTALELAKEHDRREVADLLRSTIGNYLGLVGLF